jgi:hypothetical protein
MEIALNTITASAANNFRLLDMAEEAGLNCGSVWQHRKGGIYTVLTPLFPHPTLGPVVVYKAHDPEHRDWLRPVEEWLDGRFTKLDQDDSSLELCGIQQG